jgi:hypothetical protein
MQSKPVENAFTDEASPIRSGQASTACNFDKHFHASFSGKSPRYSRGIAA